MKRLLFMLVFATLVGSFAPARSYVDSEMSAQTQLTETDAFVELAPSTVEVNVCHSFLVDLWIDVTTPAVVACGFMLKYNMTQVEPVNVTDGGFLLPIVGLTWSDWPDYYGPGLGGVSASAQTGSQLPNPGMTGRGILASVEFHCTAPGASVLRLELVSIWDEEGMEYTPEVVNSDVVVTQVCSWVVAWEGTAPPPYVHSGFIRQYEPVLVTANFSDDIIVATVDLWYRVGAGFWWTTSMTYYAPTSTAVIPGQVGNTTVEFYITAADSDGNIATGHCYSYSVVALLAGDVDGDGDVDIFDLVRIAGNYGKSW